MSRGVALRASRHAGRRAGTLATAVVLSAAALGAAAGPVSAAPYPPTVPCSLSWATDSAHHDVLIGSGYDENEAVSVTAYPTARRIGSYPTDSAGGFAAAVDPSAARNGWVVAASANQRCSVAPPPAGTPSVPTQPSAPAAAPGGPTGSGGTEPGVGSGSSGANYPPRVPTSAASTSSPGTPASASSSAPQPAPRPATSSPRVAEPRSTAPLDLPLSAVVGIAALLLLGGAVAVVVLTRRAG